MPSQTYNTGRLLARLRPSDTNAASLYVPGADIRGVEVQSLVIANSTGAAATYRVFYDDAGETAVASLDQETALAYDVSLGANTTAALDLGLWLRRGSRIAVRSGTGSALTFQLFGIEHKGQQKYPGGHVQRKM